MALIGSEMIEIELSKLKFKKLKEKSSVVNYLVTDFEDKKYSIILEDVDIPFGVEVYEKKHVINIEIHPKTNNKHHNYYAMISNFESELTTQENVKYDKLKTNIENKGYYPNIRESKNGYIIRTNIFHTPEVFQMIGGRDKKIKNIKDKRTLIDVNKIKANVELELGVVWVSSNNYGFCWYIKKIQILYSL